MKTLTAYFMIFTLCMWVSGCSTVNRIFNPYPSDASLQDLYELNREDFNAVTEMFSQDQHLWKVKADGTAWVDFQVRGDLSQERKDEYIKLLSKLKIEEVNRHLSKKEDKSIWLKAWSIPGHFIGGWSKYYVCTDETPEPMVKSLDEVFQSYQDVGHFMKIDNRWYLYLDVW